MGAAQTSNVSNAVTNLSNFVSNSTTANANQVSEIAQSTVIDDCTIQLSGDFNVNSSASLMETNNQIVGSQQDANLSNNIQQQMLQEATSKVGFAGIGFANANNSSNELINSTTQITNSMNVSANQYSNVDQNFTCQRSTIIADNMNIGFYSNSDFLSSQTLNNTQTAKIVNDITQKVTQKATATVEGIGGLLLALLLILAVIIYGLGKPLSSGAGKVAVGISLVVLLAGIVVTMYLRNTSPFFSEPSNCINHSAIGMGTGSDIPDCTDMTDQKINLGSPPIKYIYPILPGVYSQSGGNLVQMAIAQASGQSKSDSGPNGGYRADTFLNLASKIAQYDTLATKLGIDNIPNPLTIPTPDQTKTNLPYYAIPVEFIGSIGASGNGSLCTPGCARVGTESDILNDFTQCLTQSGNGEPYYGLSFKPSTWDNNSLWTSVPIAGVANLNIDEWKTYVGDGSDDKKMLFARFVLCDIIGNIDLHHWVNENELVKFIDDDNNVYMDTAANLIQNGHQNDIYFYHPNSSTKSWASGASGSGYIQGKIGFLNNRQYKFEKFMKKYGVWILLLLLGGTGFILFQPQKGQQDKPKQNK